MDKTALQRGTKWTMALATPNTAVMRLLVTTLHQILSVTIRADAEVAGVLNPAGKVKKIPPQIPNLLDFPIHRPG